MARYAVALENEHGVVAVGPDAYLDEEPAEGTEITLEEGTRAIVKWVFTDPEGQRAIAAKRLPPA
jgi:hypothetical protein